MSVDDRLRIGLRRNAATIEPQVERALASVLRRTRRRRRIHRSVVAATSLALLVLAALVGPSLSSSTDPNRPPAPPAEQPEPSRASAADTHFPEGTYSVTATRAEGRAKGFTDRQITKAYGADGKLDLTLAMFNGRWTQLAEFTSGTTQVADEGTYRIDRSGHLVMTSTSPGCTGCVGVLQWSLDGRKLTLTFTEPSEHPSEERLITEHLYTRAR